MTTSRISFYNIRMLLRKLKLDKDDGRACLCNLCLREYVVRVRLRRRAPTSNKDIDALLCILEKLHIKEATAVRLQLYLLL